MDELEYSNDAMNVVALFHEVEKMFYVEGTDDVVFWEQILETFECTSFKVQSVDGVEELKKLIIQIKNSELDSIIARDLDFSVLENTYETIPNVLTTYSHSIENTLVCENVITKVIRSHGRFKSRDINKEACRSWLEGFSLIFDNLVLYDAINDIDKKGVSVLGSNCSRFMTSKHSSTVSEEKVEQYVLDNNLEKLFESRKDEILGRIESSGKTPYDFMRGHFLFSASLKYINQQIKLLGSSKTVSENSYFSSATLAFESVFKPTHPHYEHYQNQIQSIT